MRWALVLGATLGACGFQPSPATGDGSLERTDSAVDTVVALDAPLPTCDAGNPALRACFLFDGNTLDGSQSHNDATATGTTFTAGHTGQALVTGPTSNVTVASSTTLDVTMMTLKLWIKPTSLPAAGLRAGLVDSASRFRIFLEPAGALRCALTSGADLTSPTGVVTTGTWQRVACTYDQATLKIFVGGTLVAQLPQSGTIQTPGSGLVIGQNNPTGEQFDGAIDELEVWNAIVAP